MPREEKEDEEADEEEISEHRHNLKGDRPNSKLAMKRKHPPRSEPYFRDSFTRSKPIAISNLPPLITPTEHKLSSLKFQKGPRGRRL